MPCSPGLVFSTCVESGNFSRIPGSSVCMCDVVHVSCKHMHTCAYVVILIRMSKTSFFDDAVCRSPFSYQDVDMQSCVFVQSIHSVPVLETLQSPCLEFPPIKIIVHFSSLWCVVTDQPVSGGFVQLTSFPSSH